MKDAATTTSTAAECMSSGNYFGYIAAYSYVFAILAVSKIFIAYIKKQSKR